MHGRSSVGTGGAEEGRGGLYRRGDVTRATDSGREGWGGGMGDLLQLAARALAGVGGESALDAPVEGLRESSR